MKKIFQSLAIIFVLALATSAWSAGVIKTFQLKLYDASTSYIGVDDPTSGLTVAANTNFNAAAVISSVSDFTHCGGPGRENAIPNTTDSRTIDLNDYLGSFSSGFDIVFAPNIPDSVNSGVTCGRGTASTAQALWMVGVKFSAIDTATAWTRVPVFWAGPLDVTLVGTNTINYDDRGGVTGWSFESGESIYAKSVRGTAVLAGAADETYLSEELPIQRYMRPVFAAAGHGLRNAEYWMSLVPRGQR